MKTYNNSLFKIPTGGLLIINTVASAQTNT